MVPEACLASPRLSRISVGKQGWGPSKMTLVSVQDLGYLAADGDDGLGAYGEVGGRFLGGDGDGLPSPHWSLAPTSREGPRGDLNNALLAGDLSVCFTLPRSLLHPCALQFL